MHPMKRAVRESRYRSCEVGRLLQEGQKIGITKRGRVIAGLLPASPAMSRRRRFSRGSAIDLRRQNAQGESAKLLTKERDRY